MEKINVAELLRNCPKGMELDCTMWDNVTFVRVDMSRKFPIEIAISGIRSKYLTKEGCFHDIALSPESKCVIFPKGKTTWEGFVPPCQFKEGDIAISDKGDIHLLRTKDSGYCAYRKRWGWEGLPKFDKTITTSVRVCRLATEEEEEEEKQQLFDVIKANGYKWNEETKILEKLTKFKVGDRIRLKENHNYIYTITGIREKENKYDCGVTFVLSFFEQDNWELVPNKFDITTLVPFESRVLVRNNKSNKWHPATWGFYDSDSKYYPYKLVGVVACYCIPYEGNEHLLGKTDDCDKYFKTWE